MNLNLTSVLALFFAAITGGALVLCIWRFREHYILRSRREKQRRIVALTRRGIQVEAGELRTKLEREYLSKEEELTRKNTEIELLRIETARLRDNAAAHVTETSRLEDAARAKKIDAESEHARYRELILQTASLTPSEARRAALDEVRCECASEITRLRQEIIIPNEEEIRKEARRLLLATMHRIATDVTHEASSVTVPIPSEEMKGRLIGREGRNIRAFEQTSGTTLLIDETPNSVLVSSFDPVRRETARLALEALIRDGRIHPATIEEFMGKARERVISGVCEHGTNVISDLSLSPPQQSVIELLGRLHFHFSLNQNTLAHSIEVARLSGLIASELGVDPLPARRAGLFHDIGKAMNAEVAGESHATCGARLLRRCDEAPCVVNAVAAHHGEVEPESIYAPIVMLADKISATRPGARTCSPDGYIERMKNLERIACSFPGVTEAYAVFAGREMRVMVSAKHLNTEETRKTAREIRAKIENELQYPGTIRITVIREQRFLEEAR
ncbi:MAG: ribonuclease Y [Puniceicoccales bacterium]|jgi:ribonuclease Y|nr:ribonuclease Y [Puniceicoccales bacterium]